MQQLRPSLFVFLASVLVQACAPSMQIGADDRASIAETGTSDDSISDAVVVDEAAPDERPDTQLEPDTVAPDVVLAADVLDVSDAVSSDVMLRDAPMDSVVVPDAPLSDSAVRDVLPPMDVMVPVDVATDASTTVSLSVVSSNPPANAVGVPADIAIRVLFSADLAPETVLPANVQVRTMAGVSVAGTLRNTARTVTFTPSAPLARGGAYVVELTTGLRSTSGLMLGANHRINFSVEGTCPAACPYSLVCNATTMRCETPVFPVQGRVCSPSRWCFENPRPTGEELKSISMLPDGTAWAVGANSTIMFFDGTRWTGLAGALGPKVLRGVWAAAPDDIWIVGDSIVLRGDGQRFYIVQEGNTFESVWGSGRDDVWFGGMTVWRYNGSTLAQQMAPPMAVRRLAGCSRTQVFAATSGGLYAFNGTAWTQEATFSARSVTCGGGLAYAIEANTRNVYSRSSAGTWARAMLGTSSGAITALEDVFSDSTGRAYVFMVTVNTNLNNGLSVYSRMPSGAWTADGTTSVPRGVGWVGAASGGRLLGVSGEGNVVESTGGRLRLLSSGQSDWRTNFTAVDAVSPDRVVVGTDASMGLMARILRWDGTSFRGEYSGGSASFYTVVALPDGGVLGGISSTTVVVGSTAMAPAGIADCTHVGAEVVCASVQLRPELLRWRAGTFTVETPTVSLMPQSRIMGLSAASDGLWVWVQQYDTAGNYAASALLRQTGTTWTSMPGPMRPSALGAGLFATGDGRAFAANGAIEQFQSGSWSIESAIGAGFTSVAGTSAGDVVAQGGGVAQYNGRTWTLASLPGAGSLRALSVSSDIAVVVGSESTLLRRYP